MNKFFLWTAICFPMGVFSASLDTNNFVKKQGARSLFEKVQKFFAQRQRKRGGEVTLNSLVSSNLSLKDSIEKLSVLGLINGYPGKPTSLLCDAVNGRAQNEVISFLLEKGAAPSWAPSESTVKKYRYKKEHFCRWLLSSYSKKEYLELLFAPEVRSKVFLQGFKEAQDIVYRSMFHLTDLNKAATVFSLLWKWAGKEKFSYEAHHVWADKNNLTTQEKILLLMMTKPGFRLDDCVGKNLKLGQAFDMLAKKDELFLPYQAGRGVAQYGFLLIALLQEAELPVVAYLLSKGALGKEKNQQLFWVRLFRLASVFAWENRVFDKKVRNLFFSQGVDEARKMFSFYRQYFNSKRLGGKISTLERFVDAWDGETQSNNSHDFSSDISLSDALIYDNEIPEVFSTNDVSEDNGNTPDIAVQQENDIFFTGFTLISDEQSDHSDNFQPVNKDGSAALDDAFFTDLFVDNHNEPPSSPLVVSPPLLSPTQTNSTPMSESIEANVVAMGSQEEQTQLQPPLNPIIANMIASLFTQNTQLEQDKAILISRIEYLNMHIKALQSNVCLVEEKNKQLESAVSSLLASQGPQQHRGCWKWHDQSDQVFGTFTGINPILPPRGM